MHLKPLIRTILRTQKSLSGEMDGQTMMEVPTELVPAVRELLAKHKAA
jgi:hypothetical protein